MDGQHGAGVALGELSQHIGVGHIVAPLQGHVQRIAPVEGHDEEAVLLRFFIQFVGQHIAQVGSAGPGHQRLEQLGMAGGGQQRVSAALTPAHHADLISVDVFQRLHIGGSRGGVAHSAFEGVTGVVGGRITAAHEVDPNGRDAILFSQHRSSHFIAVARFVAVGAGAVEHHHSRELAFAVGNADSRGNIMVAVGDGHHRLGIGGFFSHGGGDQSGAEQKNADKRQNLFHERFSFQSCKMYGFFRTFNIVIPNIDRVKKRNEYKAETPLDCHEERGRHGSILPPVMAHQQVERTTGRDETMVFSEGPPSLWRCAAILPRAQEMQFSLASGQIWCPKVSKRRAESPLGAYPSGEIDAPTPARVVGLPPRRG